MAASTVLEKKNLSIRSVDDYSKYKATWAQRAWFASGFTTMLISLAKSMLILAAGAPTGPRTWLHLTMAALLGYLLADLISGIYHWAIDNYGSTETPIFGSQIQWFRAHHQYPSELTKFETARIVTTIAGVITVAILPVNLFSSDPIPLVRRRKLPPVVAALQDAGVLLRWSHHRAHHGPPFNSNYCVVSGICDRVLDGCKVLLGLEVALFRVTGVKPRSWSDPNSEWKPMMIQDENTLLN
ncbi:fatty acid desaturase 4-like 1, chloroplastic [Sesamum indicum]|uniref:Fatty acid desaturase 4-like 1, chloroplastic n=1 Tax=Sesamum indicum TaxID=4182 RepID=A0A6I9TH60_SESIN|nr:fatty acid desaturase 4-like 1, chloroplastic [Sesamum indicum]